jgi:hypothetical protein
MTDLIILAAIPGFLGGMFMVWDRLFGTFVQEREGEEIVYGIRGQLLSWNPLWANLHVYRGLWRDCLLAESWKDRLKVWVAHPGWRPAAAQRKAPKRPFDLAHFQKYDSLAPRALRGYGFVQFVLAIMLTVHFLLLQGSTSLAASLAAVAGSHRPPQHSTARPGHLRWARG